MHNGEQRQFIVSYFWTTDDGDMGAHYVYFTTNTSCTYYDKKSGKERSGPVEIAIYNYYSSETAVYGMTFEDFKSSDLVADGLNMVIIGYEIK